MRAFLSGQKADTVEASGYFRHDKLFGIRWLFHVKRASRYIGWLA